MNTAFYCVANDRYFLGAVAMINSLRLVGHQEPIHLLDCGLTERQHELLREQATIVAGPTDSAPHVLKAILPVSHPAEVSILIDTDMIATRPLTELIVEAARGKVVAGASGMDRFCPEWGELLDLGPVSPRPYVSTGLVVLGGRLGREVLKLVDARRDHVDWELTFWQQNVDSYPLVHADQDLINAALAARADRDEIVVFDSRLSSSPPFGGLKVIDELSLRCAYADGDEPLVVHHWLTKPWLEQTYHGVYSQLMSRLLVGENIAIEVPQEDVPVRLRHGLRAYVARSAINGRERVRWRLEEPVRSLREKVRS